MDDLISIVVPVYHVPKNFLKKCIESIIKQSYKNIEILIPMNKNDKECKEICQNFQNQDERIKIIYENTSLCNARNVGEKNAKGKYLMFVDGDDWIEENMVKDLYENISSEDNIDLSISCVIKDYTNKKEYYNYDKFENRIYKNEECKNLQAELLNFNSQIATAYAKLFNLEFLKKNDLYHDEELKQGAEGLEFNIRVFEKAKKISFLKKYYYHYMYNEQSISASPTEENNYIILKCFEKIRKIIEKSENSDELLKRYYNRLDYVIVTTAISGYFNPQNTEKYSEKKKKFEKYLQENIVKETLSQKFYDLDYKRKFILFCIKCRIFWIIDLLGKIRYKQKRL